MKTSQGYLRYFPILIICFMVVFLVLPSVTKAQSFDIDNIVDIAPTEPVANDVFESQTHLIRQTPFGDKSLEFSIRLPNEWVSNIKAPIDMIGKDEGASLMGVVARYVSPAKDYLRSSFSLEAIALNYNVPVKYWFTKYVLSQGYSLEAVTIHSDSKIEAIYVDVDGDNSYVIRVVAFSNGSKMVLARYSIPLKRFEEEKSVQAQVLDSFKLINRQDGGAEDLKTYAFLNESYFDYPETWTLVPTSIRSIDRMRAALVQGDDLNNLNGQVGIFLISSQGSTSLKDEVKLFKDKLDIPDYKLGKYLEKVKMAYSHDMNFGVTEVYELTPTVSTKLDYELWVSVMSSDDYYYIISLLTPSRDKDFYKWARNVEAYKIVVNTMRHYE